MRMCQESTRETLLTLAIEHLVHNILANRSLFGSRFCRIVTIQVLLNSIQVLYISGMPLAS